MRRDEDHIDLNVRRLDPSRDAGAVRKNGGAVRIDAEDGGLSSPRAASLQDALNDTGVQQPGVQKPGSGVNANPLEWRDIMDREDDERASREQAEGEDPFVYGLLGGVMPIEYTCAGCGEGNETLLELEGGCEQVYMEDCGVCCRPNVLHITVDPETLDASLWNELE